MRIALKLLFAGILVAMLVVTTWASFDRNVVTAAVDLWRDPWGRATLFDTYFAFLTVYLWIAFKERGLVRRIGWFLGVMLLGNIAIAVYLLRELLRLNPDDSMATLLTRKNPS